MGGYEKTAKFESFGDNVGNYLFIDVLSEKMEIGARRGLEKSSRLIVKITKDAIKNPPKTGRKYKSLPNRSSRAGEFPANQSGKLRRSISFQMQGSKRAYIGSTKYYAQFLAFGTRRMQKRAFIGTVIKANIIKCYDTIQENINKELNKK